MEKTPSENIKSIEQKVNVILSDNSALKEKVKFLEEELYKQKNIFQEERERAKNLENQIKINNIAKGNVEGGENVKEMRAKINEVIREVDKSIRYLKS